MPIMPFPEYAPDISPFESNNAVIIENVYPRKDGYGPVNSLSVYSQALSGRCRGLFYAHNNDGSISIFAATDTRLWKLNNTTLGWTDVSKGGIAYVAIPSTDQWQFAQFNNIVIAVQINVPPQAYDLVAGGAFADLGGGPPQARYVAVVNFFLVLSGLGSLVPYRIQWSGQDAITTWTPGVSFSDAQDLPDGGIVRSVAGGETGLVTQDSAIRRLIYAPGSAAVFQIERVAQDTGIYAPLSLIRGGDRIFYIGNNGFQMVLPGAYPVPIGKERIDRTFFANVDANRLDLVIGAYDPNATRIYWGYKSNTNSMSTFDKIIVYDFVLDKWALITNLGQAEYISSLARPGTTLEALDAVAPGIITISAAANNGSGKIRLTVSGLTAGTPPSNTNLNITNSVEIYNNTGGVPAGNFPITVIDSTHIDLPTQAFTATGTGSIGGSLDQLPFSLDTVGLGSLPSISLVDTSHRICFAVGPTIEATLETIEQALDAERRVRVRGMRLIADAPGCYGSVATRENMQTIPIYSIEQQVNDKGFVPQNVSTRMARGHLRIPAGTVWTFATGIDPTFVQEGKR